MLHSFNFYNYLPAAKYYKNVTIIMEAVLNKRYKMIVKLNEVRMLCIPEILKLPTITQAAKFIEISTFPDKTMKPTQNFGS